MLDLASASLFAGLERHEVTTILAAAFPRKFRAADAIIRAEKNATHLIIVKKGFVDYFVLTEKGQEALVRRFVPGDVFGLAALLEKPAGYLGTAVAVNDVEILALDHRDATRIARAYTRFSQNAFRLALSYIAFYAHRHRSLVFDTAQQRLACALTSVASQAGTLLPSGVEVGIRNEDLASLADVGLYTACRLMKKWERGGAVVKSRGKVLIRCPEKLLSDELPGSELKGRARKIKTSPKRRSS